MSSWLIESSTSSLICDVLVSLLNISYASVPNTPISQYGLYTRTWLNEKIDDAKSVQSKQGVIELISWVVKFVHHLNQPSRSKF